MVGSSHPTPRTSKSIFNLHKPELLAPAGDWNCVKAAVENRADAIYFGLNRFNARMRAGNFTATELPELMAFLHGRGVKGSLKLNTLVFPQELKAAATGVVAAIVQDVGIFGRLMICSQMEKKWIWTIAKPH